MYVTSGYGGGALSGKGYRITTARDREGTTVRPYMIDDRPRRFVEPLTCAFCTQRVRPVSSYPKHGKLVGPYFRLSAGSEHDAECDLYPTRVLEEIARGSYGLASVAADGTLRLTLPDEEVLVPARPVDDAGGTGRRGRRRCGSPRPGRGFPRRWAAR
ncbi:hypothetical protein [Streptomyces sp. TR02-1]|uniref:hypothetical protein n=1 Tax=Streptomyces sp. TR02-1 TaxID=3385977 RepID=UPI0039A2E4D6